MDGKSTKIIRLLLMLVAFQHIFCGVQKVTYISVEHPRVTFFDRKYVSYVNLTCQRYGRANPVYYVGLHYHSLIPADNNVKVVFYFYEFLSNQYKPSFIQMQWRWCDLIHSDKFFGAAMKQDKLDAPCPYPPGDYHLSNMTVSPNMIPRGFPFTRGRIYANISMVNSKTVIACAHVDMEIRQLKVTNRNKTMKL